MAGRIRATVKARGRQVERWFPAGTAKRTIDDWKERERQRIKDDLPKASRGTLAKDVDRYLDTLADRRELKKERTRQLRWWVLKFGQKRRSDLDAAALRAALAELRLTREASTCNHYRDALYAVWRTLDGKQAPNPLRDVPKFEEPESAPRDMPLALVAKLLESMPAMGRSFKDQRRSSVNLTAIRLTVMFRTGLTPAEIKRIQPGDLTLAESSVYVRRRKKGRGSEGMTMPLTPHGVAALRAFADAEAFGPFSTRAAYQAFVRACKRLSKRDDLTDDERRILREATLYDLRHTFGTFVLQATQDLKVTQELMRHRSAKTTKRYVRSAVAGHLRAAVDVISAVETPASDRSND
jgi:integrase